MNPSGEQIQRASEQPAASLDGNGASSAQVVSGPSGAPAAVRGALGLWDAVSIIVGIVVGAGIYQTAPFIFKHTDSPQMAMITWAVAGVLSLVGALCYAELATTYPRDGGDIVYLTRAYGRWAGFLFGWVQLTVILTGSIGMMAFVFANYSLRLFGEAFGWQLGVISTFAFAGGAILVLTIMNVLGVVFGKTIQNVLTLAKVLGLTAIIVAGFYAPTPDAWSQPGLSVEELKKLTFRGFAPSLGVALVLILYTYGGWNDAAFVAAEVRDGKKNITRALVIGIFIITLLYLLVNAAYLTSLGFPKAQGSRQIAADVLNAAFGKGGVTVMCILVMISSLGAVNGLIFTGARVYATIGKDYPILSWMSGWNRSTGAPAPALLTQGVLALALVFLVGTTQGRNGINQVLETTRIRGAAPEKTWLLEPMDWEDSYKANADIPEGLKAAELANGGFDTLVACTAPIFWGFFLMTGLSVFILRERDTLLPRPFKVPLYPELPLVFCLSCGYMLYSSISYALGRKWTGGLFLLGVLPLLVGLLLYRISRLSSRGRRETEQPPPV
jgi:APA family basic amino acid/polyamine antiporter